MSDKIKIKRKPSIASGTLRRPEIDALLTGEHTLKQIAEQMRPLKNTGEHHQHLTRERIRQYIKDTSQDEIFKQNREKFITTQRFQKEQERKEKYNIYRDLATLLVNHFNKEISKASWAEQKTIEYNILQRRINHPDNIPLRNILKLLENYKQALDSGICLSLKELGENSGINNQMTVSGILKKLNLNPLYGSLEHHITPQSKKDAILRAYSLDMPINDIAYFLGLPYYLVEKNMRRKFGNIGNHEKYIKRFGFRNHTNLTYRIASMIYKDIDNGSI